MKARTIISVLVAIHVAASAWHGNAHQALAVALTPTESLFVYVVILAAPVVGAVLLWTRWFTPGVRVVFASMLAAFAFGVYNHFLIVSPDHVAHLPPGTDEQHMSFILSAGVIALLELVTSIYAASWLFMTARPSAGR